MDKDRVYNKIKEKILTEELPPGQWLVEREISEKFQISRTPVRELLRRLVSDGLVSLEPSKGYYVRKLSIEEIIEIFQAREAVEGQAARLSCIKGDELFFNHIATLKRQFEQLDITKDSSSGIAKGTELHDAIINAANNSVLSEFYQKLKNLNGLIRNITKKSIDIENQSKKGHLALTQAILDKDPEKSGQSMREHLSNTCRLLMEKLLTY
ncbi:MAG: GntR family transcriptional regulator [Desulfobacterales bacterium]|nr:MAG: GntR family transcriptional regulator [Desulfobacterales bacterium]